MDTNGSNGEFLKSLDHWQSFIYHPVVASLTGAVGAAFHAFPGAATGVKSLNGISSFFIGIYAGPALIEWRGIESMRIGAAIIIACALGGLITVNAVLEYMRTTRIADWPVFRTVLGKAAP